MSTRTFFGTIFFIVQCFCVSLFPLQSDEEPLLQFSKQSVRQMFVSSDGELRDAVVQLLKLDGLYKEGDTLHEVVIKTQNAWVAVVRGKEGKERSDLVDKNAATLEQVVTIARNMGLFDAKVPALSHYDYALWLGATLDGVRFRFTELVKAWQAGIRFDALVVLTGERFLRTELEGIEQLCDSTKSVLPFKEGWTLQEGIPYETECDMMRIVWDQVQLPEDMAKALEGKVFFVNTKQAYGLRPSTKDTYLQWMKEYRPLPGSILAVSHPGLWVYQQLVGANVLGGQFFLDTIAPAVTQKFLATHKHALVSIIHDTVAKCLYEVAQDSK